MQDEALRADYSGYPPGDKRYTAPEVLASLHDEHANIAFVGDFYSLGAVLFEMFTGVNLGVHLFGFSYIQDLVVTMMQVPRGKRTTIYRQLVPSIVSGRALPSFDAFGNTIPASINSRLNQLYQSLAALDYEMRLRDFSSILRQIDICLLILRNEQRYINLRAEKQRRRLMWRPELERGLTHD